MTAEELADRFDISLAAARIRVEEINKMRRRRSGGKRQLPPSVIKYLDEAAARGIGKR
jgi:hypothetical protein